MEYLPLNTLIDIALSMSLEDVYNLCKSSSRLNQNLCENESFWQSRYLYEFGQPESVPKVWRNAYLTKVSPGQAWSFGINFYGILGRGGNSSGKLSPGPIPGLNNVTAISAGTKHNLILDDQGKVWVFGDNEYGQLGLNDIQYREFPTSIPMSLDAPKITAVSAGTEHSLILDEEGQVWSFGRNDSGQLGLGDKLHRTVPYSIEMQVESKFIAISAGDNHSLILNDKGQAWLFGWHTNSPALISMPDGSPKITDISAGKGHSLILDEKGQAWAFGNNEYGQLGVGNDEDIIVPALINMGTIKIIAISAGANHSLILDAEGRVWAFGLNKDGILGTGDLKKKHIQIPTMIQMPDDSHKITAISAGKSHSLLLDELGQVWSFGDNYYRQLGSRKAKVWKVPRRIPIKREHIFTGISAGEYHNLLLEIKPVFTLFNQIKRMINENLITDFQLREKLDTETNYVFQFTDKDGDTYLAEVQYDPETNQIFHPL